MEESSSIPTNAARTLMGWFLLVAGVVAAAALIEWTRSDGIETEVVSWKCTETECLVDLSVTNHKAQPVTSGLWVMLYGSRQHDHRLHIRKGNMIELGHKTAKVELDAGEVLEVHTNVPLYYPGKSSIVGVRTRIFATD